MVALTILLVGCLALVPLGTGAGLIALAVRAQRLHARQARVEHPGWAVRLGWLLGTQLLLVGAALGVYTVWAAWIWWVVTD